jgi:class 3 adenylate cyclase
MVVHLTSLSRLLASQRYNPRLRLLYVVHAGGRDYAESAGRRPAVHRRGQVDATVSVLEQAVTGVPRTRWARTADGACIAYQDLGSGPVTLLVVHGWVSHLEVYWEQPRYVRFLTRLSRHLRVLVFDKRGIGMSDRVEGTPDLGVLLDDVRAVLDAAGVERAALLGWGGPGPELAAFFAATYPERTLCLTLDGFLHERLETDYPWGDSEAAFEAGLSEILESWGEPDGAEAFVKYGYGRTQEAPYDEPEFRAWNLKLARFAATPASYEAFERMWYATDVRPLLPSVATPTAIVYDRSDPEDQEFARVQAASIPIATLLPVASPAAVIWVNDPEPIVSAIEAFIASVEHEEAVLDRRLATVLFTDLVGSTQKACRLGDARWAELLERHNSLVRAFLARYRGSEVKTTGDGFLATFDGPARAVTCAQAICGAVQPLGLEVRAGCHTGEVEVLGADVGGIAVHIGARICALAAPSEVLVSSTVKDLVAGSGLVFEDRGDHGLKGVPGTWRLHRALT